MLLESAVDVLNSAAIVMVSIVLYKYSVRIKKTELDVISCRNIQDNRNSEEQRKFKMFSEEIRKIRLEMTGQGKREPLPEEMYDGCSKAVFLLGNALVREDYLDDIADLAIKTIVSELREEFQTPEVINDIIARAKRRVSSKKIKL